MAIAAAVAIAVGYLSWWSKVVFWTVVSAIATAIAASGTWIDPRLARLP